MTTSDWLLAKLRCPLGGGALRRDGAALVAGGTGRRWPLTREGIPDLFVASDDAASREVEEANSAFHDGHAEVYDAMTVRPDDAYDGVSRILERLRAEHGRAEEVLDAGCGSGVVLRRARPLFAHVAGVDVSRGMLARCLALHGDLVRASVLRLPFDDASFDGATAYSLLHHLRDPAAAFRELARVLRPGGFLYTDNDSSAAFHRRFGWWLDVRRAAKAKRAQTPEAAALERTAEFHHGTGLDAGALRTALLAAGFASVELEYEHPPRPDEFTKLLMRLEAHEPSDDLRYYFRIVARR